MNQSRLNSSQELVLHHVHPEQKYSPASFTNSVQAHTTPRATLGPLPSGSSSTGPAAIVLPAVRKRSEWTESLESVEPFTLSPHLIRDSHDASRMTAVRYIADVYDRAWLARRAESGGLSSVALGAGKTGSKGGPVYTECDLAEPVFEDAMTALELAAFYNPEIPLERVSSAASAHLVHSPSVTDAVLEEVHQYWIRKRAALGGHIPCIPSLKVPVRDDNQTALCHADILGDCPLPFRERDWCVSTYRRKDAHAPLPRKRSRGDDVSSPRLSNSRSIAQAACALSREMLHAEKLRLEHTHLALYELALLRETGSGDQSASLLSGQAVSVMLAQGELDESPEVWDRRIEAWSSVLSRGVP